MSTTPALIDRVLLNLGTVFTRTRTIGENLFLVWADSVKLRCAGKIQKQDQLEYFKNLQSFANYSMEL